VDIWRATKEQIITASLKHFGKAPTEILRQSGLWAYVYFADGTNETVYEWMI
jgi:hypothetical protein